LPNKKSRGQLIWGAALILAGIGVFIRIPQVMPRIATIEQFASVLIIIRGCFYLMGIMLIGGGVKKFYDHWQKAEKTESVQP